MRGAVSYDRGTPVSTERGNGLAGHEQRMHAFEKVAATFFFFFFTLVTSPRRSLRLKLSNTRVYEPQIRAPLGTTAHLCRVVVLKNGVAGHEQRMHAFEQVAATFLNTERGNGSGRFQAVRALTSRLIFLAGVKWSCLRINEPAFPPVSQGTSSGCTRSRKWRQPSSGESSSSRSTPTSPRSHPDDL